MDHLPDGAEASTPAETGDAVEDFADFLDTHEEEKEDSPDEGDTPEAEAEGEEAQPGAARRRLARRTAHRAGRIQSGTGALRRHE